jgi:hypothetical protein
MYIFLDDERIPTDVTWAILPKTGHWHIVRNYDQFVELLKGLDEAPTFIAFDHDLAESNARKAN